MSQHETRAKRSVTAGRRPPRRGGAIGSRLHVSGVDLFQRTALVLAWILLIIAFGILEPDTFLTTANFQSIFGSQAVLVVLTLGLLVPLTAGDYDLSIGSVLALSGMTVAVLNVNHGWAIGYAILVAIAVSALIGVLNGALTLLFDIDPFIVTLGVGTVAGGVTLWISNSSTISGVSNELVDAVFVNRLFGIPLAFYYGLALCVAMWYFLEFTPPGRRLLFAGRGRVVARLNGLHVARLRFGALVASATLSGVAGIMYVGTSSAADPSAGLSLLLPAFAAAFFGATAIVPGRFNPWGSFIAVYFLTTGIAGLILAGVETFVQDLFYGGALVAAVVLARVVRKPRVRKRESVRGLSTQSEEEAKT